MLSQQQVLEVLTKVAEIGDTSWCGCEGEDEHLSMPASRDKLIDCLAWVIMQAKEPPEQFNLVANSLIDKLETHDRNTHAITSHAIN